MPKIELTTVSGKDLQETVSKMAEAVVGTDITLVFMSCLALALMTQDEEIGNEALRDGVLEASKWMTDYLAGGAIQEGEVMN